MEPIVQLSEGSFRESNALNPAAALMLRAPTPVFVAVSEAGVYDDDPALLAPAFDAFFELFKRQFSHTDVVLLTKGDCNVEHIALASAHASGFASVRVTLERANSSAHWARFIEKHCLIVFLVAVQSSERRSGGLRSHGPVLFRIGPSAAALSAFSESDDAIATIGDIDEWNADVASDVAFDANLCATTFEKADVTAVRDQKRTHDAVNRVFWYTVFSGLALQTYDHLTDFLPSWGTIAPPFALVFVVFILAAVLTVRRIRAAEVQSNFQDRRSLAEGLRVQSALLESGIDIDIADRYPAEAGEGIEWIRRSIDAAYLASSIAAGRVIAGDDREPVMRERPAWIAEQRNYYGRAATAQRAAATAANRVAVFWLRLSIFAALLIAADGFARLTGTFGIAHLLFGTDHYAKPAFLMTLAIAGSLAALTKGKSALRGHRALANRYGSMCDLFANAERLLDELKIETSEEDERSATRIVVNLAYEALAENAEWHASMRSRPLQSIWSS